LDAFREAAARREKIAQAVERAQADLVAYEQETRRAILRRPWWWRFVGLDHVKRR
jgi:hypothetical protein